MTQAIIDLLKDSAAIISVVISTAAFFMANKTARNTKRQTELAIAKAEEANRISKSRQRTAPLLDIYDISEEIELLDLSLFDKDLETKLSLKNKGDIAFENIHLELIGICPFTFKIGVEDEPVRPLPSILYDCNIKTMIQPKSLAHIDLRKPILDFIVKLSSQLMYENTHYNTRVNVVVLPTAVGDPLPSGTSPESCEDTKLINIRFNPNDFKGEKIQKYSNGHQDLSHRVYTY